MGDIFSGGVGLIIIFLFVLGILWFLLPFAVFGIKDRLEAINETNRLILKELKRSRNKADAINQVKTDKQVAELNEPVTRVPTSKTCTFCYHENGLELEKCTRCGQMLKTDPVI